MAIQIESHADEGVATLLGGIVQDARRLLEEQLQLFQVEIRNDFHRTVNSAISLVAGAVVGLAGVVTLGIGVAYLLGRVWPDLPLWVAFVIVGGVVTAIGLALFFTGMSRLNAGSMVPDKSIKELKENINAVLSEAKEESNGKRRIDSRKNGADPRIVDR